MVDIGRRSFLSGIAALAAMPLPAAARDGEPDIWELAVPDMERLSPTVWIAPLQPGVWIVSCTFDAGSLGWIPTNALILDDPSGPTLIDTGCTVEQGEIILGAVRRVTGRTPAQAIATHFHDDRTGGIAALRAAGVPVYAHPFSVGLAQAYGAPVPDPVKGLEKGPVTLGPVELFYPGAGHTRDNITVWHPSTRILFGGCLLRATSDTTGVGSLADADLDAFPATIDRLIARYPTRRITVPGHGTIAGDALAWTRTCVEKAMADRG